MHLLVQYCIGQWRGCTCTAYSIHYCICCMCKIMRRRTKTIQVVEEGQGTVMWLLG